MGGKRDGKAGGAEVGIFKGYSHEIQFCMKALKVPKREIFDRSDFPDFYTIKSSWVGDLLVKILTYYYKF